MTDSGSQCLRSTTAVAPFSLQAGSAMLSPCTAKRHGRVAGTSGTQPPSPPSAYHRKSYTENCANRDAEVSQNGSRFHVSGAQKKSTVSLPLCRFSGKTQILNTCLIFFYTEFHPKRKTYVGSVQGTSFTPLNKVRFALHHFPTGDQLINSVDIPCTEKCTK